jgi:myosin-6
VVENQKVWVEDAVHGFVLGRIVDLGAKEATVQPLDPKLRPVTSPYDRVFPAEDDDNKDVNDNCRCYRVPTVGKKKKV